MSDLEGGVVPAAWLATRVIGEATIRGTLADVGHAQSLAYLRLSSPRTFTREISSHIYRLSLPDGAPRFAGVEYDSRLGDTYQNWAIFERPGRDRSPSPQFGRCARETRHCRPRSLCWD